MTQKNQMILLATLVLIMTVVWYFNRNTTSVAPGNMASVQKYQLLAVENPQLHRDKMDAAQKTEYHSLGRNPFSEIAPPKEHTEPIKVAQHVQQAASGFASATTAELAPEHEIFWIRHNSERNLAPRFFVRWR